MSDRDNQAYNQKKRPSCNAVYLQPVLQLEDRAVQDGGRQFPGDGDHLGHSLIAGRCNSLDLLLKDLICANFPMTLGKVTLLLIQQEFGLHWTSRVVPDLDFDLEILALKTQGENKHVNFPNQSFVFQRG